ncbi:MAG: hypothetical protein KDI71_22240, partial [Xanthomonadales bacterium]|nr:hypothetical protein [Xanthomonadales bacterium]
MLAREARRKEALPQHAATTTTAQGEEPGRNGGGRVQAEPPQLRRSQDIGSAQAAIICAASAQPNTVDWAHSSVRA